MCIVDWVKQPSYFAAEENKLAIITFFNLWGKYVGEVITPIFQMGKMKEDFVEEETETQRDSFFT